MTLCFSIGDQKHACQVIRTSRKRSIGIEVCPYKGIIVHAPSRLGDVRIKQLLEGNSRWIKRRLELLRATPSKSRFFCTGGQFLFLGQWLQLQVVPCDTERVSVDRQENCLEAQIPSEVGQGSQQEVVKKGLVAWYMGQATEVIAERLALYAPQVGVDLPPIRINRARRRWGSCGINGRLNFPWRLVMAPVELVDYVVVHELCHLLRRDHSAAYWKLVAAVLPDYHERRHRLRLEGPYFDL